MNPIMDKQAKRVKHGPDYYAKRVARFFANGIPKYVRVYDNGGTELEDGSIDRYTVVFTGNYAGKARGWCQYIGMSAAPFHPQGFGQHGEADHMIDVNDSGWPPAIGRRNHLGRRIHFADLPADCQKMVLQDYVCYWDLLELDGECGIANTDDYGKLVKQLPAFRPG